MGETGSWIAGSFRGVKSMRLSEGLSTELDALRKPTVRRIGASAAEEHARLEFGLAIG